MIGIRHMPIIPEAVFYGLPTADIFYLFSHNMHDIHAQIVLNCIPSHENTRLSTSSRIILLPQAFWKTDRFFDSMSRNWSAQPSEARDRYPKTKLPAAWSQYFYCTLRYCQYCKFPKRHIPDRQSPFPCFPVRKPGSGNKISDSFCFRFFVASALRISSAV